ncbi:MAG: DUF4199 domain-containing protein [Muribaculaceae bacterium]|nr:DUF4199 domain-containing protein [Muribaculaceae bacterium]
MYNDTNTYSSNRSLYALAAGDGLVVGLIMVATFLTMVLTPQYSLFGPLSLVLMCFTPYLAWRYVRKHWIARQIPSSFSAVWLTGICIFLFGAIILALGIYIILGLIFPGWIEAQTLVAAERLASAPETYEQSRTIMEILRQGLLPSPISVAVSMIWLVGFTGSLWSLIFAFIATRSRRLVSRRQEYGRN